MIGALLKVLNPLAYIVKELKGLRIAKANAETEQQRIEADVDIAALEAQQALLLREQDNFLTRSVRPLAFYPFIAYLWKSVFWDKVVKGNWSDGVTDNLSTDLWNVFLIMLAAFFTFRGAQKVVSIFRR